MGGGGGGGGEEALLSGGGALGAGVDALVERRRLGFVDEEGAGGGQGELFLGLNLGGVKGRCRGVSKVFTGVSGYTHMLAALVVGSSSFPRATASCGEGKLVLCVPSPKPSLFKGPSE